MHLTKKKKKIRFKEKSLFNGKKGNFLRALHKSPKEEKHETKQRGHGLSLTVPHFHKVSSPEFIILLPISPFGSRENEKGKL
jgi:hypothetical protein